MSPNMQICTGGVFYGRTPSHWPAMLPSLHRLHTSGPSIDRYRKAAYWTDYREAKKELEEFNGRLVLAMPPGQADWAKRRHTQLQRNLDVAQEKVVENAFVDGLSFFVGPDAKDNGTAHEGHIKAQGFRPQAMDVRNALQRQLDLKKEELPAMAHSPIKLLLEGKEPIAKSVQTHPAIQGIPSDRYVFAFTPADVLSHYTYDMKQSEVGDGVTFTIWGQNEMHFEQSMARKRQALNQVRQEYKEEKKARLLQSG